MLWFTIHEKIIDKQNKLVRTYISEFQKEFTSKFKKRLMINDNSYLISMYNISV